MLLLSDKKFSWIFVSQARIVLSERTFDRGDKETKYRRTINAVLHYSSFYEGVQILQNFKTVAAFYKTSIEPDGGAQFHDF